LLKTDRLNVELEYKVNTDKVYGNDIFQANMNKSDALSWLQSTVNGMLQQHMKVPSINVSNRLYRMIVGEKTSLSIQSVFLFLLNEKEKSLSGYPMHRSGALIGRLWECIRQQEQGQ